MPWRDLSTTAQRWLSEAPLELRSSTTEEASEIALWEANRRADAQDGSALEPLLLWAQCSRAAGSGVAGAGVLDAVRIALGALRLRGDGKGGTADGGGWTDARTVAKIVCAAASAGYRDLVIDAVAAGAVDPVAYHEARMAVVSAIQEELPDARLWWAQLTMFIRARKKRDRGYAVPEADVDRLERALRRSLKAGASPARASPIDRDATRRDAKAQVRPSRQFLPSPRTST